jgi:hypothetical protein
VTISTGSEHTPPIQPFDLLERETELTKVRRPRGTLSRPSALNALCDLVGCFKSGVTDLRRIRRRLRPYATLFAASAFFALRRGRIFSTAASAVRPCFLRRMSTAPCSIN